ncbi:MAG: hypothetical protein FWF59_04960 [Turicibacter sp.]|nr:hypothetical protein [Turicibacter sp.]
MKLHLRHLFQGGLLCLSLLIALPVHASTEKDVDTVYKYTPANAQLPWIPENYADTDWNAIAIDCLERILSDPNIVYEAPGLYHSEKSRLGFVTHFGEEPIKENVEATTLMTLLLSADMLKDSPLQLSELKRLATKVEGYYSLDEGENVFLNYMDIPSRKLTFYDQVYPGLMYFMLMDRLEPTTNSDKLLQQIANGWYDVVMDLGGTDRLADFVYTGYDFANKEPFHRDGIIETDAAAGIALIQFYAYQKFQDRKYIRAASYCMDYLDNYKAHYGNRLLYFYMPYLTARMNSEQGFKYDLARHMGVAFEPTKDNFGWLGTGLIGSRTEYGGTAYTYESIMGICALIPTVKYDPRYANEIGRAILHTSHQLAGQYPYDHRSKDEAGEGLSIKAQSALGIFASVAEATEHSGILKVDLNVADFYQEELDNPCFLLYNPYAEKVSLNYHITSEGTVGLYDLVTQEFIQMDAKDVADVQLPGHGSVVLLEIPIEEGDNLYKINRKVERQAPSGPEATIRFVDLEENAILTGDTELHLDMVFRESSMTNLSICVDDEEVYKNVGYEEPFTLKLADVTPGYHLLQAKMQTTAGTEDSAYLQVFVEKDDDAYFGATPDELAQWNGESPVIEVDFSQSPILELRIPRYLGPWSMTLEDTESGASYVVRENSIEAGQLNINLQELVEQEVIRLYGTHKIRLRYSKNLELEALRIYNEGYTPLTSREWAYAFTPPQMINWPAGHSGQLNYRHGKASIRQGVSKTDWFKVELDKKPQLKLKVEDTAGTWALLAYLEGESEPRYLQYPTDESGTFTYDLEGVWDVFHQEAHNIQFWLDCEGEADPHTYVDYVSLAYQPSWLRLGTAGLVAGLSLMLMLVEMRRES